MATSKGNESFFYVDKDGGGKERDVRDKAAAAKAGSLVLQQQLSGDERRQILIELTKLLNDHKKEILEANEVDKAGAKDNNISEVLLARLKLTEEKINNLIDGILKIANSGNQIGKVLTKIKIMEGLEVEKITAPIGVLLVIFEARPEVLIQIASLAIATGNGVLLKGGKESSNTNKVLHQYVEMAIRNSAPKVNEGLIGLVSDRSEIPKLLECKDMIDLVIPRGSYTFVKYIQEHTLIPVLGHSEGICNIYVSNKANLEKAIKIIKDAKLDYPAACNAVDKVIVNKTFVTENKLKEIIEELEKEKIELKKGKHESLSKIKLEHAPDKKHEYSSLGLTIEVVESLNEAIEHINENGSHHTDVIVTEDKEEAEAFIKGIDSSCVFWNASTRWSDGFRFGLGAEVGVSTSKIHARGPVGADGLFTTKYVLRGNGHVVNKDVDRDKYKFIDLMNVKQSRCPLYDTRLVLCGLCILLLGTASGYILKSSLS